MTLSNKKIKYIQRFSGKKAASQISRELKIPVEQVLAVMGNDSAAKVIKERDVWETCENLILPILIVVAPLLVFERNWDYTNMPKAVCIQIGTLLWLTFWFVQAARKGRLKINKCPLYLPLAGFVGWALLSLFWAQEPYGGFTIWAHWCACGTVFFLALQSLGRPGQINRLLVSIAISGTLVASLGCAQYLYDVELVKQTASPASTFANKNMGAQMMIIALPAGAALFLSARRSPAIWFGALSTTVMATYLFYTFTRAAWLSVMAEIILAGLIFMVFIFKKGKLPVVNRQLYIPGATSFILLVLTTNYTPDDGMTWRWGEAARALTGVRIALQNEVVEDNENEIPVKKYGESGKERLALWSNILEMIKDHPARGVGLYNFIVHYPLAASKGGSQRGLTMLRRPAEAHNDYLQVTAELGIPFLVFLFWSLTLILKQAWRVTGVSGSSKDQLAATAFVAGICGLGVDALFSFPFYRAMPPFALALFAAGLYSAGSADLETRRPFWRFRQKGLALSGVVAGLVLIVVWTSVQYRWMKADRFFRSQRHAMNRKEDWQVVINLGEKVRKYNSFRKDTQHLIGRAYAVTGRPKEALHHLEAFDRAYPHNGFNLFYLAQAYGDLQEFDKATTVLEHATKILPQDGFLQGGLGQVYQIQGRHEDTLKQYRLATELLPQNSFYHSLMGSTAASMGKFAEAESAFSRALALKKDSPRAHKGMGELLINIPERKAESIPYLERALELDPNTENAQKYRKIILDHKSNSGSQK